MIRKGILVAVASASLAVGAATPLGALEAPAPSSHTEAVRASVPDEHLVPAPAVAPAAPRPSASSTAAATAPTAEPEARKPQAAAEAPRSASAAPSASKPDPKPQRAAQPERKPVQSVVTTLGGYRVCEIDPPPAVHRRRVADTVRPRVRPRHPGRAQLRRLPVALAAAGRPDRGG